MRRDPETSASRTRRGVTRRLTTQLAATAAGCSEALARLSLPRWSGARPAGWVGVGHCGAGGSSSVSGVPAATVTTSPWWASSSGWPFEYLVRRLCCCHLDLEQAAVEGEAEGEALQPWRQSGREGELPVVVAHPAEAGHRRDPGTCKRRDVHAVDGVVLQVVEVHEGRLAEVVIGELEVPHLGGDHRLCAGRQ